MIPFNRLGWVFHHFGSLIYPAEIKKSLCMAIKPLPTQARVLDIGAGTGILCRFAAECKRDLELHAIDPAEGMLKYCSQEIISHLGTAEALPFKDAEFDAVMIGEALHHFDDIERSMEEITRVLKSEGRIFIYDFDPSKLMGKVIAGTERLLGEPGHFFVPESLQKLLESYGFEAEVHNHGFRYTLTGYKV
jgi:demethylmenaquinone methyltransferase/2-methoxy-6-polyprenyl-1,4-benzoquinol methylase